MMNMDRMEVINVEVVGSAWWSMQTAETVTSRLPIKNTNEASSHCKLLSIAPFSIRVTIFYFQNTVWTIYYLIHK